MYVHVSNFSGFSINHAKGLSADFTKAKELHPYHDRMLCSCINYINKVTQKILCFADKSQVMQLYRVLNISAITTRQYNQNQVVIWVGRNMVRHYIQIISEVEVQIFQQLLNAEHYPPLFLFSSKPNPQVWTKQEKQDTPELQTYMKEQMHTFSYAIFTQ